MKHFQLEFKISAYKSKAKMSIDTVFLNVLKLIAMTTEEEWWVQREENAYKHGSFKDCKNRTFLCHICKLKILIGFGASGIFRLFNPKVPNDS